MNSTVKLCCIGTGDAFGSGGCLNSCYHLAAEGEQLLLDCGCSSLIGMQRCGINPAGIDAVLISHLHGDHFGGLAFLLLEAKFISQRQRPLALIGPPGLQQQVEMSLEVLYPGAITEVDFPIVYRQLDAEALLLQGVFQIKCCQVKHGSSPDVYALRVEVGGRTVCYSGDTEWTENLVSLVADSDLFIAECYAYAQATPSHLDYQTLLAQRERLKCKRLMLTHLGMEMQAKKSELELEVLNDGDLIEL